VVGFYWDIELSNSLTRTIDASYWSFGSKPSWLESVLHDVKRVVCNEKIQNGIFHLQIIEDDFNTPHVIDVTRRLSGDMYGKEVHFVTGFDLNRFYLSSLSDDFNYEFNHELFSDQSKWKNFFRFVCVENTSGAKKGTPRLLLNNVFDGIDKKIYQCLPENIDSFKPFPWKRIFICHFYPSYDAENYKEYLSNNLSYKIEWSV